MDIEENLIKALDELAFLLKKELAERDAAKRAEINKLLDELPAMIAKYKKESSTG